MCKAICEDYLGGGGGGEFLSAIFSQHPHPLRPNNEQSSMILKALKIEIKHTQLKLILLI